MTRIAVAPPASAKPLLVRVGLMNLSDLAVGGGVLEQATSPIDIPLAKMPLGDKLVPYIPASTLKGLLRSLAEQEIAKLDDHFHEYSTVEELTRQLLAKVERDQRDEIEDKIVKRVLIQFIEEATVDRHIRSIVGELAGERSREEGEDRYVMQIAMDVLKSVRVYRHVCNPTIEGLACELPAPLYKIKMAEELGRPLYPCPVCQTYGAPGLRARIEITHALPVTKPLVLTRRHVAIDRVTGAAAQQKLFDIEYLPPGHKFTFYITLHIPENMHTKARDLLGRYGRMACEAQANPSEKTARELSHAAEELANRARNSEDPGEAVLHIALLSLVSLSRGAWIGRRKSAGYGEIAATSPTVDAYLTEVKTYLRELEDSLRIYAGEAVDWPCGPQ